MATLLTWEGTDDWRAESALVLPHAREFTASGVQLGVAPVPYRLDYRLTTTDGWVTAAVALTAAGAGWRRAARLARAGDGHWSFSAETEGTVELPHPTYDQPALAGALDCDLGFSPLTNTMPILRGDLHRRPGSAELTMAWISVPDLAVRVSRQRYEHLRTTDGGAVVRFSSGAFTADLVVDGEGFVVDYPDLARRVGA